MMPKVGFYAVRVGREIGVYNSWDECKNQTEGYPNARYKRFNTLKAAEDFAYGTFSSTLLPSISDGKIPSEAKGKKRAHAEIEDESGWDVVYADGACKGNGKVGAVAGAGVWWGHDDPRNIAERCPGSNQTNNRAELFAILLVLETAPLSKRPLLIKTDSKYSIDCFKWIHGWMKNHWKTASGKPVRNEEIIRCVYANLEIRLRSGQKVHLQHVKGHVGEVGNEGADHLATEGALNPPVEERDWKAQEARLVKVLGSIAPNTASNALVSVDTAEQIPLGLRVKLRKLEEVGPSHQPARVLITGRSELELTSSAIGDILPGKAVTQPSATPSPIPDYELPTKSRLQVGVAEQEWSGRLDKPPSCSSKFKSPATTTKPRTEGEFQDPSIQIPSDNPRLVGNAKKPAVVSETPRIERTGLAAPLNANVSPNQPVRLGDLSLHAPQFLEGPSRSTTQDFYADPSTQSPVRVIYAAPPLVPVCVEDVDFEDYADCLLDDADLALDLSD